MTSFARLFPNPSFVDVLILFLLHPDEEIYQSRIVSTTGRALMQVQRALRRLQETGLITKTKSGNRVYYKANRKHPGFEEIKKALLKTVIFGDTIKKALIPLKKKIQFGFIYGSVARAEESPISDIDLFLVGDLGIRDVASILGNVSHQLEREINPTIYPLREFKKKLKEKNSFIIEVIHGAKIWLIGEENEFEKMGQ